MKSLYLSAAFLAASVSQVAWGQNAISFDFGFYQYEFADGAGDLEWANLGVARLGVEIPLGERGALHPSLGFISGGSDNGPFFDIWEALFEAIFSIETDSVEDARGTILGLTYAYDLTEGDRFDLNALIDLSLAEIKATRAVSGEQDYSTRDFGLGAELVWTLDPSLALSSQIVFHTGQADREAGTLSSDGYRLMTGLSYKF